MAPRVRIYLFATAREAVGAGSVTWPVPPSGTTVRAVVQDLARRHPRLGPVLGGCRYFVNGQLVARPRSRVLSPDDEISIHPPYSGG